VTSGNASTPASWRRAMRLIEEGAVELDPLVTEVVPLAEWERAFVATRAGSGMKYVLDPRPEEDR
ncbi:MAG: Zn-dependent alcohol dehydrogenase, partial [Acidimicrobiia bacterium]|nr:Zn-dependent alcohol dehydrogenase [Acidimicrobiia bacterium]